MDERKNFEWTDMFFEDDFDIDQFLAKFIQEDELVSLRVILHKYTTHIHNNMAKMLKTESKDILAKTLLRLLVKIDNLVRPVEKLTKLIMNLYKAANVAKEAYCLVERRFDEYSDDQDKVFLLDELKSALILMENSFELRFFSNISHLEGFVHICSSQYISLASEDVKKKKMEKIVNELLKLIHIIFIESINQVNFNIVLKCLKMYEYLGKENEAEVEYRTKIVHPAMEPIFNVYYLKTACKDNLDILYHNAFEFIGDKMHKLHKIVKSSNLKKFDFLLHSYWAEVDMLSRERLRNILELENPDVFLKNFNSTKVFLIKIATECGNPLMLRYNSSFVEHLNRFNLSQYFEMRQQQIVWKFSIEIALHTNVNVYLDEENNEYKFKLALSTALWNNLIRCFSDDIYIEDLNVRFVCLTTIILDRYLNWLQTILENPLEYRYIKSNWEKFLMSVLFDLELAQRPGHIPMPLMCRYKIPESLSFRQFKIEQSHLQYKESLIEKKISDILPILMDVISVPCYYRQTNRNLPESASSYVIDAVKLITLFHTNLHKFSNDFQSIFNSIVKKIMGKFISMVRTMLTIVGTTEDPSRCLKKNNIDTSDELPKTDEISNDMKIRKQIHLDVKYLLSNFYDNVSFNTTKSLNNFHCNI